MHLYVEHARPHHIGLLWVSLRATRRGFLPGAVLTASLVTLILILYWRNAHDLQSESETAAAVLLLVPALMAGFLIRPGDHEMAQRLLRFPRYCTTIVAALPLVAAAALVVVSKLGDEPPPVITFLFGEPREADWKLTTAWLALAVVAALLTLLLTLSWRYPREGRAGRRPFDHSALHADSGAEPSATSSETRRSRAGR